MHDRQVFAPADPRRFIAHLRTGLALGLVSGLLVLESWDARLFLLGFAAVFGVMVWALLGWYLRQNRHPLTLDATGMHSALLASRYGCMTIPWQEIAEIDLVAGLPRGSRWLRVALRPGAFRATLRRPVGDRVAGWDVNLLCAYAARPQVVLQDVRAFWQRYAAAGTRVTPG